MADTSHLEKMGRELKCPICLSLLNSAVSLTCNHVFCNSCISESMKSASNCPVCKVPYRRREVRAAPHMDNLVSIYKSMELTSGINIFVSQNAPCKKTDVEIHGNGDSNSDGAKSGEMRHEKSKKRSSKRKEVERITVRLSDSDPSPKPSFPAKKRVRVPKCSLSETPTQREKFSNLTSHSAKFQVERNSNAMVGSINPNNDSAVLKEKPVFNEKGEPVFQPFFWLRERDDDDDDDEASEYLSAQQMEGDFLMGTSPFKAPCFSDLKDTDDGSPVKMTPNGEGSSEFKAADVFDSEMFEWTQRACSPELSLTPMKRLKERDAAREIDTSLRTEPAISKSLKSLDTEQENESINLESPIFSKQNRSGRAKNIKKKIIKGHKRPNSKVHNKSATSSTGRHATASDEIVRDAPTSPIEVAQIFNQDNDCTENANVGTSEGKHRKKNIKGKHVKVSMNQIVGTTADKVIQEVPSKSREVEGQNKGKKSVGMTKLTDLSCQQTENDELLNRENKIDTLKMKKCVRQPKNLNTDTFVTNTLEEIPKSCGERMENQENIDLNMELHLQCPQSENDRILHSGKEARARVTKLRSQDKRNIAREPKEPKRLKIYSSDATKYRAIDEVLLETNRSEEQEHPVEDLKFKRGNSSAKNTVLSAAKDHNLQKCENVPKKIQCAFCQSWSDSEASGEMLHYFDGKPVAANYNNGFNVIHSHRNCTEWAPNVYFDDDIVINLETEIARSKRIKCSCCGVKGASLGCYEKSCRKSFHVPCAKLVPECRWDIENFVMLCPLHSSSKLRKEIIVTHQQRRNKTAPKLDLQARTSVRPSIQKCENWKWPSALPSKWVICCSALTAVEKEIVSNFTRMVGVSVSKTWSPAVTHVIASTDENGACKRTLKFLMGILEGKWILKIDWITSCMTAMEPDSEEKFEISTDVHGIKNGPRRGRLRVINKEPKLFNGLTFHFVGDFAPTYKGYLQNLVVAGGGIVLHRRPISRDQERLLNESSTSTTFIIYSLDPPEKCDSSKKDLVLNHRRAEAHTLANATGAKSAGHTWIMDSIAASKLQELT